MIGSLLRMLLSCLSEKVRPLFDEPSKLGIPLCTSDFSKKLICGSSKAYDLSLQALGQSFQRLRFSNDSAIRFLETLDRLPQR